MAFDAHTPIYVQIADDLRRRIATGDLKEGDQLMSTTQYSKEYRINPATAQKAFQLLVAEELVEKRRGIGMFVAADARATVRAQLNATFEDDVLKPALIQAKELGFSAQDIADLAALLWKEGK
ncbi:MAG: GntR family transcriptional regulator [Actinomycetaceae bacterium]|nr:GntR family transcriptional regulator [Actinomycetaceae bacterium]